jgi:hypothetical protein
LDPVCGTLDCGQCLPGESCQDGLCHGGGDCLPQETLTCGQVANGTNAGAPALIDSYSCVGWDESGPEYVYAFSVPATSQVTLSLGGLTADLDLFVLQGACQPAGCLAYGDQDLTFQAEAGEVYFVVVDGYAGAESPFTLTVDCGGPQPEICDDGLDNDGDGAIDCADPDCATFPGCASDFCPGYAGANTCCQNSDPCGWAADGYCDCDGTCAWDQLDCGGPQPEICDDGLDNDGDGAIDCADPDCATFPGCASDFCPGYAGANTCCQNSDPCGWAADGYCDCDGTCAWDQLDCGGPQPEICDDGLDNDGDGAIDCADPDCATFPGCASDFCPGYAGANTCCQNSDPCGWAADGYCDCDGTCAWDQPDCGGPQPEICDDGLDNDGDGAVDCADPDCATFPGCGGGCVPQETLTCGQVANGTNAGAPALIDSYSCVGWDESGPEYVYAFSVPATSQVTLSLGGLTADLDLFVLQGACQPAGCLAYGDQDLTFQAEAGEVYFVVVDGYAGAESPFTLTVACGGPQPEICDDGLDNDGDGAIDCADPDCATFPGCASDFCPGYTGANTCCQNSDPCGWAADGICDCDGTCAWDQPDCGGGVEICDNFHDDDGDGAMDCADPDCAGDPACAGPFDCANPLYFWDFGTLTGTTLGAPAVQSGDCGGAGPEVVYAFGVGSPLCIRLSTAGSAFDTVLHVREDNCTDPAAQIACNDDFGGSFVSEVEFTAQPGPMYYVFVDSYAAGGDYAITISECAGPQPEICDNGQDDDGDGATDCADPDCIGHPACGASGDCCTPHPTPGCDDPAISACVCAQDPYCCDTEWDSYCVDEVTSFGCGACP